MDSHWTDAFREFKRLQKLHQTQTNEEPRDGDDLDLTVLVNDHWNKASFGYPIQDCGGKPTDVAQMVEQKALENYEMANGVILKGANGRSASLQGKHTRFNPIKEFEKLHKQFE